MLKLISYLYTTIVRHYCECGKLEDASRLYREMIEYKIDIDSLIISQFVVGFGKSKHFSRAEEIFRKFKEVYPDNIGMNLYNAVLPSFIMQSKYNEGLALYEEMCQKIPVYSFRYTAESSVAVAALFAWKNDITKFKFFLDEILEYKITITSSHFLAALKALNNQKYLDSYSEVLQYMDSIQSKKGYRVALKHVYNAILEYLSFRGNIDWVQATIKHLETNDGIGPLIDDMHVRGYLAIALLRGGQTDAAIDMCTDICAKADQHISKRFASHFFEYLLEIQDFTSARAFLPLLGNFVEELTGLFRFNCARLELDDAFVCHTELLNLGVGYRPSNIALLIETCILCKRFDDAEKILEDAQSTGMKSSPRFLNALLRLTIETRDFDAFLEMMGNIKHHSFYKPTQFTHEIVMQGYIKHEKYEEALIYFIDFLECGLFTPTEELVKTVEPIITQETPKDIVDTINRLLSNYQLKVNPV